MREEEVGKRKKGILSGLGGKIFEARGEGRGELTQMSGQVSDQRGHQRQQRQTDPGEWASQD